MTELSSEKREVYSRAFEDFNLLDFGNRIQLSGILLGTQSGETILVPTPEGEINGQELSIMHLNLEEWNAFLRQTDLLEVEVLMEDEGGIKKAILRKTTRQINTQISWAVYRRDEYRCRYCGAADKPLTVDHLILWEEGGPSIEENLVTTCKKCNKTRGNMKYTDWLNSKQYAEKSVNLTEDEKLKNYQLGGKLSDIPIKLHIPSRGKKKKRMRR